MKRDFINHVWVTVLWWNSGKYLDMFCDLVKPFMREKLIFVEEKNPSVLCSTTGHLLEWGKHEDYKSVANLRPLVSEQ